MISDNIDEILGDINTCIPTSNFGGPSPCLHSHNFSGYASRPIGWGQVEVIAKVPSRYTTEYRGIFSRLQSVVPPHYYNNRVTVSLLYVFIDVRLSHLNKDYLVTYLLIIMVSVLLCFARWHHFTLLNWQKAGAAKQYGSSDHWHWTRPWLCTEAEFIGCGSTAQGR